ncbi:MAG: 23S rRNA (adenine(2503)-C(2))-methyltransferase RlmN [Deltaproteobacteria bacterium]|nr:23S rRNA (adenine(2503)-C(2))-methyltransferase RlmN [Deltaproteobacteria bacterium]
MTIQTEKKEITDFSIGDLEDWFESGNMKSFRAGQVMRWIFLRGATSFDEMTDLAKDVRALLSETFTITRPAVADILKADDGTRKYLFCLSDGNKIESVLIPEKDHYTLCISSQIGCAMGCRFCMTATMGLIRNLTPGEILGQVLAIRDETPQDMRLSNIVFMGMGEPLANINAVISAMDVMTDGNRGLKLSRRKITVSTCGLVPMMERLGKTSKVGLAVSLNATDNATRDMLMPVNQKYPIEQLMDACARYPLAPRDKITIEYILIKGVNDSEKDAVRLAGLLAPISAKVNLIPFNAHKGSDFKRPDRKIIDRFQSILVERNYTAIIRWSKGADIGAACGQLAGA